MRWLSFLILFLLSNNILAKSTLNIYTWGGYIPTSIIKKFEHETGIKINLTTYDSNELMYAKLKASSRTHYDIIQPSSYYISHMKKKGMLTKLDSSKISNVKYLDPYFIQQTYDANNEYSIPYLWGATGIFVNDKYHDPDSIKFWAQIWDKKYRNQLLLLNDLREVFSIAMITLGHSINEHHSKYIKQAYQKLLKLLPNVKLFTANNSAAAMIDEDITIGMIWSGDLIKAARENVHLKFIYPQDGFALWIDCLAIPKGAPHLENAYTFINFMLRPEIAREVSEKTFYASTNLETRRVLENKMRENYPDQETLKRAQLQTSIPLDVLSLYTKYWELLKISA